MFIIDYDKNKDKFLIEFDVDDSEEFQEHVKYLKSLWLKFDVGSKKWIVECSKMDEIALWFKRDKREYSITTSCQDKINEIANSYTSEIKYSRGIEFDKSILNKDVIPFKFQEQVINWALKRNNILNALDAGLGKTFISICQFGALFKLGKLNGIFIIAPLGLSFHWKYSILEFVNCFKEEDIVIIDNETKNKPFENNIDKKIIITSNHLLADIVVSYKEQKRKTRSKAKIRWNGLVDIRKKWNKDNLFILCDESHNFKNSKAIKTKALFSIKNQFKYKCLCSATPFINRIEDAYSQITFLDKSIIPMSENAWKLSIADSIGNKFDKYAITNYNTEKVEEFHNSIKQIMIKINKEDVDEMKVKKIISKIYFDLTLAQRELYQRITEYQIAILENEYDKVTWRLVLQKLQLICEVIDNPKILAKHHYDDPGINRIVDKWKIEDDPKFIVLNEKIKNIVEERNEKIIIYDIHPETLDTLYEKFQKYSPLIIHGSLKVKDKEKDRKEKEDLFNNDPRYKIFLLSALTSSAGLNLQKMCNRIEVYTMPWDSVPFRQLQDRTTRITSEKDSYIEVFCYPKTIDNIRVQRNFNRVDLNDKLGKEISREELQNLLRGIV